MNQNRRVILNLYKHKIKICRDMNYKYGKWDYSQYRSDNVIEYYDYYRLKKMNRTKKLGHHLMNNIRCRYKLYSDIKDEEHINDLIDNGFSILRDMNNLKKNLKK